MGGIMDAIEYLGIPGTVAVIIIALFLIMQIIGELVDLKSKTAPEFLKIRKYFMRKRKEKKEMEQTIKDCQALLSDFNSHYDTDNITKRDKWMDKMNNSVKNNDAFIQKLDSKIDKLLEDNENFAMQLEQVKSNVLENEADRLRSELFDCGNRCRRNIRLHPEEMEHIRVVFNKYSNVLHQNGQGEAEFRFIVDYYNRQDFPTYHEPNR